MEGLRERVGRRIWGGGARNAQRRGRGCTQIRLGGGVLRRGVRIEVSTCLPVRHTSVGQQYSRRSGTGEGEVGGGGKNKRRKAVAKRSLALMGGPYYKATIVEVNYNRFARGS